MIEQLTQEWRASQQRLTAMEAQYAAEMLAYFHGRGELPPDELKAEILVLRKQTSDLLARALREIDRRLDENERRLDKF